VSDISLSCTFSGVWFYFSLNTFDCLHSIEHFLTKLFSIAEVNSGFIDVHPYGGWLRPFEKKKFCSLNIISCSHNLLFCSHKKDILFPQHTILFPQHIILFPQYIILFSQHIILFPQYIIIPPLPEGGGGYTVLPLSVCPSFRHSVRPRYFSSHFS
jgi:hypothetical protein